MHGFGDDDDIHPPARETAPKLTALFDLERSELEVGNATFSWQPPARPKKATTSVDTGVAETSIKQSSKGDEPTMAASTSANPTQAQQQQGQEIGLLYAVPIVRLYRVGASGQTDLGAAGIAILGVRGKLPSMRSILFYDPSKKPHLQDVVKRSVMVCTPSGHSASDPSETIPANIICVPQPKNYAILYDQKGTAWQALFRSAEDWKAFATQIALAKYVAALCTRSKDSPPTLVVQDIVRGEDGNPPPILERGDTAQVCSPQRAPLTRATIHGYAMN
eukprot:4840737-Pyramimonas_sp.AAC.1